jgi:hypothetical protein
MMSNWTEVNKRGRVRPARGGPPGAGGQGQGDQSGGAAPVPGRGGGAPRQRGKLPSSDTKANVYDRPNTVVIECQEFSILPPVEELAPFIVENVLKEPENKNLFQQIASVFSDENARKYLIKMRTEESTGKMADLLAAGVIWPGYPNVEKGRDVMITGYSMQNPIMYITMSGIGWWTSEKVVRSVVEKWGDVKELTRVTHTHYGNTFETDKWAIKLVKKKEIVIPPVVLHAGSERSCDERELWKVFYRGVIRVCYRCLKEGHMGRDCQNAPVTMEYLAGQAAFEEAPAAIIEDEAISGQQRTFAQIVKDDTFVKSRLAREKAAEKKKQEMIAKAREEKELKENKEKQRNERGRQGKGKPGAEGRVRGFSIDKLNTTNDWSEPEEEPIETELERDKKRVAGSPAFATPDSKAVKTAPRKKRSQSPSKSRSRPPGLH